MNHYEIRYKKVLPYFILVMSIFILGTTLLVGFSVNAITGIILLIVSLQMLTKPIAVITPNEIHIKNLLGMTLKNHPYTKNDLSLKEDGLYLKDKKIVSGWIADINAKKIQEYLK